MENLGQHLLIAVAVLAAVLWLGRRAWLQFSGRSHGNCGCGKKGCDAAQKIQQAGEEPASVISDQHGHRQRHEAQHEQDTLKR